MRKMLFLLPVLAALASGAHAQTTAAPAAAPASAPEPTPSPLTANIALTSNYKFRGQDQGNDKPAIQGGFDYTWNGFYVGNWNSSIGFTNAGIEMDFYGGYKGELAKDVGYDVGLLQYYYPQKTRASATTRSSCTAPFRGNGCRSSIRTRSRRTTSATARASATAASTPSRAVATPATST